MDARGGANAKKTVVLITPVFNEEGNLAAYESTVKNVLMSRSDVDYRVVFIDDGSRDASWELICGICARDARFKGLRLSRNFGPHAAIHAGVMQAFPQADAMVVLACDLQDPAETVLEFVASWLGGNQIVWGVRRSRQDGLVRSKLSNGYYQLMRRHAMPAGSKFATGSFFLMDRKVAECYLKFREFHRITFAMVAWTGFRQVRVEYDRQVRLHGRSGWGLTRMLRTMFDSLVGYSQLPIMIANVLSFGLFLVSLVVAAYIVIDWLFYGTVQAGWPSLMFALSFFFGLQFFLMGLMGEYLSRIYIESVRRPTFFIADTTSGPSEPEDAHER
jgi:polyisoprenyl-phosphate glycosyltransferase